MVLPMADSSHTIREEISGVAGFIGAIWAVYFLSWAFPAIDHYGVVPRTAIGLVGIPAMPFLHANLHHLLSNTIPLAVLLILLAGSRVESWEVVAMIALLGGFLLWIVGRPAVHIGASGLISGLTAFLILSGFLEQRVISLLVAILVGFFYGGSLILGVIPQFGSNVSWDGHLCGAIAGCIVAYALARGSREGSTKTLVKGEAGLTDV
jgi:membrane associated rhomboid family serine protease